MAQAQLLPEALEELRLTARFYESKQPGLGRAFLAEIRDTLELLARHPDIGTVARADLRVRSVARFPYRVYYRHRANTLLVVAVAHRRRRPGFWLSRDWQVKEAGRAWPERLPGLERHMPGERDKTSRARRACDGSARPVRARRKAQAGLTLTRTRVTPPS